jgi:hypothetical protein
MRSGCGGGRPRQASSAGQAMKSAKPSPRPTIRREQSCSKNISHASTSRDCGAPFKPQSTSGKGRRPAPRSNGQICGQDCRSDCTRWRWRLSRPRQNPMAASRSELPEAWRCRVLLAPFRAGAAHIMQLRLVGWRGHHRAPSARHSRPHFHRGADKAGCCVQESLVHLEFSQR